MKWINWELERIRFESALSESYCLDMRIDEDGDLIYEYEDVRNAWLGWRLCRRYGETSVDYRGSK